ncbi:MAG: septation regulator SpoVG [Clostridiales bacterium]|nr:septation regulator SpoVG [Clostridiales bacterium]
MNITSIIIRKLTPDNKMKAIVSITFDDSFVVHDVKVIDGANGLFIAMPSRRIQDGEFKDIVHPIHSAFRDELSRAVLAKYFEALEDYNETLASREKSKSRDNETEVFESQRKVTVSAGGEDKGDDEEKQSGYSSSLSGQSMVAESNA